jgi:hypothetical protein
METPEAPQNHSASMSAVHAGESEGEITEKFSVSQVLSETLDTHPAQALATVQSQEQSQVQ